MVLKAFIKLDTCIVLKLRSYQLLAILKASYLTGGNRQIFSLYNYTKPIPSLGLVKC